DRVDRRCVDGAGDQVVGEVRVQALAVDDLELLHDRVAEPLHHAALDLADQHGGVDRLPDVVRGGDVLDHHPTAAQVDGDLGDLGGEAVDRVGLAHAHRLVPLLAR